MYGVLPPRQLPQQDPQLVLILADRYARARVAHEKWAEVARECVDFMEGRQWDANTLRDMARNKRPVLTLNKLARQIRLVLGYFENNPNQIKYLAGLDGTGSDETAEVLNRLSKQIDELNDEQFLQAEQMMDGLVTGRGFMDSRLDFENNDFGEVRDSVRDPFNIFMDPDGDQYDISRSSFTIERRVTNLDEVECYYGVQAKDLLTGFARQGGESLHALIDFAATTDIAPPKGFGQIEQMDRWMQQVGFLYGDLVDPFRKDVTLLDFQYWVRAMARVFIDLTTGDRAVIPDDWTDDRIAKVLDWTNRKGENIKVVWRPVKKVRWTTLAGPLMVYDKIVPYDSFSLTGYFPYFRRGITRGMAEDLLDPQREVNKRRSARIEILSKTANGGWLVHEQGMSPMERTKLKQYGSTPGVVLEWKGESHQKPEQLRPEIGMQRLEKMEADADRDFGEISGINESALGDLDRVQSGRAIEARQRQAVVSVQVYMTNRNRTIQLLGRKRLEIIKRHYTEPRIIQTIAESGQAELTPINQRLNDGTGTIKNDVTRGRYQVVVDETPISATFLNAQFDEAMDLIQKMGPVGAALLQLRPDLIVDMSSLPRKEEWKEALAQALQATQQAQQAQQPPMAPAGAPAGAPPSITTAPGPSGQLVPVSPTGAPPA